MQARSNKYQIDNETRFSPSFCDFSTSDLRNVDDSYLMVFIEK